MAIEIVDFPINSMVIFHSYVNVYQTMIPRCFTWDFLLPPFPVPEALTVSGWKYLNRETKHLLGGSSHLVSGL